MKSYLILQIKKKNQVKPYLKIDQNFENCEISLPEIFFKIDF